MNWRDELLNLLSQRPCCGYGEAGSCATEPSALAALALLGEGRMSEAERVGRWLLDIQSAAGTVGVSAVQAQPDWPTSLAVMVWTAIHAVEPQQRFAGAAARGVAAILSATSDVAPQYRKADDDSWQAAWPWVHGTYSWVEPTAFHVLALRSAGQASHPRVLEAQRMLFARQTAAGGWNYGNAEVLNQPLRSHVQPTGIALLALPASVPSASATDRAVAFLRSNLTPQTATASLCWGLLGLAAHGCERVDAEQWLAGAYQRTMRRDRSPWKLALIALALQGTASLLVTLPLAGSTSLAAGQLPPGRAATRHPLTRKNNP